MKCGQRINLLLVFFLIHIHSGILLCEETEPASSKIFRTFYKGVLSGETNIQIDLKIQSDHLSGFFYNDISGERFDIHGTVKEKQNFVIDLLDEQKNAYGSLEGSFGLEKPSIKGMLKIDNNQPGLTLFAVKMADYIDEDRNDLSIKTYTKYQYPQFLPAATFMADPLNELIINHVNQAHQDFITEPAGKNEYRRDLSYIESIIYYSEEFVSLLFTRWVYFEGAAHGNTFYETKNYWFKDHTLHVLGLSDLFQKDSHYIEVLSQYCIQDLKHQKAMWVLDGSITEFSKSSLSVFVVNPHAIEFYFAPYLAGPYSDGPYQVRVPWEVLSEWLDPNGPAPLIRDPQGCACAE